MFVFDIPGHPNNMLWTRLRAGQCLHDIAQGLAALANKVIGFEFGVFVPAHHACDINLTAAGLDAI